MGLGSGRSAGRLGGGAPARGPCSSGCSPGLHVPGRAGSTGSLPRDAVGAGRLRGHLAPTPASHVRGGPARLLSSVTAQICFSSLLPSPPRPYSSNYTLLETKLFFQRVSDEKRTPREPSGSYGCNMLARVMKMRVFSWCRVELTVRTGREMCSDVPAWATDCGVRGLCPHVVRRHF